MTYLLDTSACIAVINGQPVSVRLRLQKVLSRGAQIRVSSVVLFELWYGVAKSARPEANAKRVETFFAGPVSLLSFDEEDARVAGEIRAALEAAGKPIGAYDVLIAGQAMRHNLTAVTANAKEFGRVKGLAWENWGRS
ncbi:MAG: type II toxin-antitoxin system VapC family toxin [Candidatus Acidiferrales bacterium]